MKPKTVRLASALVHPARAAVALMVGLLLWTSTASAGIAGRERGVPATVIAVYERTFLPNRPYIVETDNLSPGADTVLYVWSIGTNRLIAANDDYDGSFRSGVIIPAAASYRDVRVLVRAYANSSSGSANLIISSLGELVHVKSISFTAGYSRYMPNFSAGTHFFTIEEQSGASDTVLLITSSTTNAIAIDDNNGMGLMSWVHVGSACTTGRCRAFVGSAGISDSNNTTFMWDEDIHNPSANCDADGMSDTLEAVIGTQRCNNDTDDDGLDDGVEVMGLDGPQSHLTRFPYMGSDPLKKDVFVEVDWTNNWFMPGDVAERVAELFAPDVRVHIDTGQANTNPATRTVWGDWGGASQVAEAGDWCAHLSPVRATYFHGAVSERHGGGQAQLYRPCLKAGAKHAVTFAHELGHNFGLTHGGRQSGLDVNCKPNYRSLMNYAFGADPNPRFSRNQLANWPLVPLSLNEQQDSAAPDPDLLDLLALPPFQFNYDSDLFWIDWNRNGMYEFGTVRGAPTWASAGCDIGQMGRSYAPANDGSGSALVWARRDPIDFFPTALPSQLYWFTRRRGTNRLLFRTSSYGGDPGGVTELNWTPPIGSAATIVPNSLTASSEPAAVLYTAGIQRFGVFLLYVNNNSLYAQSVRNGTWGSPIRLGPGQGDPAAVFHEAHAHVYVRNSSDAGLLRYTYSVINGWSGPFEQRWTNGSRVTVQQGIGVTSGYMSDAGSTAQHNVVGLIPLASPAGQVELARWDPTSDRWSAFPSSVWPQGKPITTARPSIAYVPYAPTSASRGRYYLAWRRLYDSQNNLHLYTITFTEGNRVGGTANSERFVVNGRTTDLVNVWQTGVGSVSLLYDLLADRNLRIAWTWIDGNGKWIPSFSKVGDQVLDGILEDQDDFAVIRSNLRCSLKGSPCPL